MTGRDAGMDSGGLCAFDMVHIPPEGAPVTYDAAYIPRAGADLTRMHTRVEFVPGETPPGFRVGEDAISLYLPGCPECGSDEIGEEPDGGTVAAVCRACGWQDPVP